MSKEEFREWVSRNPWLKHVPNALTVGNSLCGFSAILYTLFAYDASDANPSLVFAVGAAIILFASVFDAFDGFTARIFDAISVRGMEMDSLSDMVSFGVAPATLVAVMVHRLRHMSGDIGYAWVWAFCAMYVACVALRLSKYNTAIIQGKKSGPLFHGLPCPGAAAAICSVVLLYASNTVGLHMALVLLPFYAAFVSLLMISHVRYLHLGLWLGSIKHKPLRSLYVVAVMAMGCRWPLYVLFAIVNGYVISGPLVALFRALFRRGVREEEKEFG